MAPEMNMLQALQYRSSLPALRGQLAARRLKVAIRPKLDLEIAWRLKSQEQELQDCKTFKKVISPNLDMNRRYTAGAFHMGGLQGLQTMPSTILLWVHQVGGFLGIP